MKKYKTLNINGATVDLWQLQNYLEKEAAKHNVKNKSNPKTYPVPHMKENYEFIRKVYNILDEHLKLGINIHPAGEWVLDNFYIIEEAVRNIEKELTLKKYTNFVGLQSGEYEGFARIYVISAEIVAYTDGKIEGKNLEKYLEAYQTKKTLDMDEIWNIGIFLQIAIIEKIRQICEKIYSSEIQKFNVENIIERLVENKSRGERKFIGKKRAVFKFKQDMKYPFIEYMSYSLKRYGKKACAYLNILEEEVEKTGATVSDVIRKEHFDIAVNKVSIGNSIMSIKDIQRINFLEIFEKINGVEEILKQDPAGVYEKMDYKTKEYYRSKIKELSKKIKVSEIYMSKKILELAKKNKGKKAHIGYYLIDDGINELYTMLGYKKYKKMSNKDKAKLYISSVGFFTIVISLLLALYMQYLINILWVSLACFILLLVPISELVIQIEQYILSKLVKPKLVPKLNFYNGIDEENSTFVVIPTIIKSKEKVRELMKKLEIFYLANKSNNLYFALLGDCSQSNKKHEDFDDEVIAEGIKLSEELNQKYKLDGVKKFYFLYRERFRNEKENCYLGWERKRGMLNQFNDFLLGKIKDPFLVNTISGKNGNSKINNVGKIPKIKYIITLDSDTDLTLNSAFELVGAMAHILNKPVIDNKKNIVVQGYGIMQPRVGVNIDISYKNWFTKIFAGSGGIDSYTNAISDIYQDNFGEGIFTGKGIYDLEVFSNVLSKEIPENTVLSHDLLEGCYLRCALVSDVLLMDGYPSKYNSFMNRLSRWIRGDWQIIKWLCSKLNLISKYKIFDNLRRSVFEIATIINIIFFVVLNEVYGISTGIIIFLMFFIIALPFLLEILNSVMFKRGGEKTQKSYTPKIAGIKGAILRGIITIGCFPYKAIVSQIAIAKTLHRMTITHKNLLEWTTSEEAEKMSKTDLASYYKTMFSSAVFGILAIAISLYIKNFLLAIVGILWIVTPYVMWQISKDQLKKFAIEYLNENEKGYILDVAKKTWNFFYEFLNEENNYLIPDNLQENRKEKIVFRTSSTNIGLSLLAVISGYNLNFISQEETFFFLERIINTVQTLPKWNGHLYNWYNIRNKEPLIPRYISTVDSGNFVGYLYVTKGFLERFIENCYNHEEKNDKNIVLAKHLKDIITEIIDNTNFEVLYSKEHRLFSIGFNIEENKLTDSYYDLLATEARQASLVAIAKRDVPVKHWNNLSRTLTLLNKHKGLVSWSGTAFEYLMPNINIPRYEGSLLDESCKFMIECQIEYCRKLGVPWGISEAAFNLKDLQSNYQYKAFGLPWLGLKRGLADEVVVSTYASVLAILDKPKEVIENLRALEKQGMYGKFGFFESIDYTPQRLSKGKKYEVIKTYMAHHQALILLSINNLFNNNILQQLFVKNPEISATSILLQERMPETFIITNESKEKPEKIKYKDYENYIESVYTKIDERLIRGNVISNEDYTIAINQNGEGFSKYKDVLINRFKKTSDNLQGIFFYIKDIKNKRIWSSSEKAQTVKPDSYKICFMPDKDKIEKIYGNIKTKINVTVGSIEPVEIRRLELENTGNMEEMIEVTSFFEPVLSQEQSDFAHQSFNNLFLVYEYDEESKGIVIKRKNREQNKKEIYLATSIYTRGEQIGEIEYEIDRERFITKEDFKIPKAVKQGLPLSKKIGLVTEPIVAMKSVIRLKPKETAYVDLIISVSEEKNLATKNLKKYEIFENTSKAFELSRARCEAESRYLGIKGKQIENYQKMLSYILFQNPLKKAYVSKLPKQIYYQKDLWKYGISGDSPILLVTIKDINDIYVIKDMLKCYEFFKTKNIEVELVILNEEPHSYENYIKDEIERCILNSQLAYEKNIKNGIFVLNEYDMSKSDIDLIKFVSSIIIDSHLGSISNNIQDLEEEYLKNYKTVLEDSTEVYKDENVDTEEIDILENTENLKYYNEYGAFSENGKEYFIKINKNNRLPAVWSHVMANKKFGTIVTENMGGYTWYKNSRLNRLTAWNNSSSLDMPSEVIYIKELDTGKAYSLGASPMPDNHNYNVIYGFGYARYIHKSQNVVQELDVFVPKEDSIKVNILTLKNQTTSKKKFKLVYYIKPVLGEDEIKTDKYIKVDMDKNSNMVWAENLYNRENLQNIVYVSSSEEIKSYTGDKKTFLGKGDVNSPDGIKNVSLDNQCGLGSRSCIAVEIEVEVESLSNKQISIVLGAEETLIDSKNMAYKYSKIYNCNQELENIKNYWKDLLGRINVVTPLESMNIILNGWCMYQTISSRLFGRSGFYQSGGAFGFRDQLQDVLGVKYLDVNFLKNQIIKHSKHQFIEGDVEHWWHDETERGIRTRFSDDLLWLAFCTIEYINFTGDYSILDIETNYISGNVLEENQDERYDLYLSSDIKESIYKHCIRAINKSLDFGENGLPKIGSGDWNDGLSTVGNKGKGESVWLGFFLYYILEKFIEICKRKEDFELAEKYKQAKENLNIALNTKAWDGRWYKRAFMDDGNVLGSMTNDECKIDGISQSWSVISGAGDNDKKYVAMESLENHLVDRENGIIKLLDPPFEKGKLEPGYIKAYLPGVRENGGQYTHASLWAIIAEAMLGYGDKALEFFRMINPIEHSRTKDAVNKYKVEPYVIVADIYGAGNLTGRGGWTWYTGSSSWFYKAGIEYILGIKVYHNYMKILPCIPSSWKEYSVRYKFGDSVYNIRVKNPNGKFTGVQSITLNGKVIENNIPLDGNGKICNIEVIM